MKKQGNKEPLKVWIVYYYKDSDTFLSIWGSEDLANDYVKHLSTIGINGILLESYVRGTQGQRLDLLNVPP